MSADKQLDFLRVLIAAAWADGDLTYEELNNLKRYFRELALSDDKLAELRPYLQDPIEAAETETIITDFLTQARGAERETLMAAVRDMVLVDGELHDGERKFLELLESTGEQVTTAGVFVARLKQLWGSAPAPSSDTVRRSDLLDEFIRNRVLYQVKRRLLVATGLPELDADTERELRYVCALGALLGHVAGADQVFDDDERAAIAEILDAQSSLRKRDVDIIVDIVKSEVLSDVGYFDFTRELNELAGREERLAILGMLFEVAAADGEITYGEKEEIRKISKALNLEHAAFIRAKLAYQTL